MTPFHQRGLQANRAEIDRPWWGLGDVAIGIVASQLLSVFVVLIVFGVTGWQSMSDGPLWVTALLGVPLWIGLTGAVVSASGRKGFGLREDFGLSMKPGDVPLGLAVGVGCQLLLLPLLYWPLLALLDRSTEELSAPARELSDRAGSLTAWVVLAVTVVAVAPVVEELFYRGLLLAALEKKRLPEWVAVGGSAGLFAAMHFQALQFMGLFVFGVVLAVMARMSRRLGPSIWAHVGFNATTVVVLYTSS